MLRSAAREGIIFRASQLGVIAFGVFLTSVGHREGELMYTKQYYLVVWLLIGMILLRRYWYHRLFKRYHWCREQLEALQAAGHLDSGSD